MQINAVVRRNEFHCSMNGSEIVKRRPLSGRATGSPSYRCVPTAKLGLGVLKNSVPNDVTLSLFAGRRCASGRNRTDGTRPAPFAGGHTEPPVVTRSGLFAAWSIARMTGTAKKPSFWQGAKSKAHVTIFLSDKTATRFVLSAEGFCFARESAELARIKALLSATFDFHGREQLGNYGPVLPDRRIEVDRAHRTDLLSSGQLPHPVLLGAHPTIRFRSSGSDGRGRTLYTAGPACFISSADSTKAVAMKSRSSLLRRGGRRTSHARISMVRVCSSSDCGPMKFQFQNARALSSQSPK